MGVEDSSFFGSGSHDLRDSYAVNDNLNKYVDDEDTSTTSRSKTTAPNLSPWIMRSKMVVFLVLIVNATLVVGYFAWFCLVGR